MKHFYGISEAIGFSQFCDAWNRFEDRKNSFSYEGKRALFDYLEELANDMGKDVELDIVALDCEYTEYTSAREASDQYGRYYDIEDTEDKIESDALSWLQDRTQVITFDRGVIIQNF